MTREERVCHEIGRTTDVSRLIRLQQEYAASGAIILAAAARLRELSQQNAGNSVDSTDERG